jgi:hypothetical protein
MNGIKGTSLDFYQARIHRLRKYFEYPEDFHSVYSCWANGPRSNGAMPKEASVVHEVVTPAKYATVRWHDAVGCTLETYYYTDIRSRGFSVFPEQLIGDYPFSNSASASVTLTVVGQKRLPPVATSASFDSVSGVYIISTSNPENDERIVIDRRVGTGAWENSYRVLTGGDTSFVLTDFQSCETYGFRAHAETYNQVGPTGPEATITAATGQPCTAPL